MSINDVKVISHERKTLTWSGALFTTASSGSSDVAAKTSPYTSFQVVVTTTSGNGSATVQIQVSNDDVTLGTGAVQSWLNYGTAITVASAASPATNGFPLIAADMGATVPWRYVRATITAIAGTNAQCYVIMGF